MGFLTKKFSKNSIIVSDNCVHESNGTTTGRHYGVVRESDSKRTIFNIFSSRCGNKYKNVEIDKEKFSNDFGDKILSKRTFLSGCRFWQRTKKVKRVKGGGKYYG